MILDDDDDDSYEPRKQALKFMQMPGQEVEVAVSSRSGLGGFAGFHTSILVAGEEYVFAARGIRCYPKLTSHRKRENVTRSYVGVSQFSCKEMLVFMQEHFRPGSYDFLRHNCNSYTDCALYFLCGERLDLRYRAVERIGWLADSHTGILRSISKGQYTPNPLADNFSMDDVLQEIDAARGEDSEDGSDGDETPTSPGSPATYPTLLQEGMFMSCFPRSRSLKAHGGGPHKAVSPHKAGSPHKDIHL
mmetsp:Transcript_70910/g.125305  ORF Transcript_70910/g.125305 Transcript_70910/m.125305 type:complete len:247 (-) Transcript_70910:183-923(-)|eukprot:CAMPEP_0197623986 /NCGR_PEP_ID=MMETSP1338-20131121/3826_1 /TAXON_ID=43686 ORGANISM="Pelagodinium beii, Strain RCC1491" /NCGR_SAMPLE_ID=MMETSP1338 /ASSEMBLY_ACC=CAM_ASM_000754 /LENGTH=246 /DNA_ID=CAMNT_0043194081 /DNA_START=115 /DNA_END=855 /DNA_ORIENTATION=-